MGESAVSPLTEIVCDDAMPTTARSFAFSMAAKIGDPSLVDSTASCLIKMLENSNETIRESVRYTLFRIGEYMIEPLIDALENLDDTGRTEAIRVLRELTGKKFKNDLEIWRAWWAEQGKNKGI